MKMPVFLNVIGNNTTTACGPVMVVSHSSTSDPKTMFFVTGMSNDGSINGEMIPVITIQESMDLNDLRYEIFPCDDATTQILVWFNESLGVVVNMTREAVEYTVSDGSGKATVYRMSVYNNKVRTIRKRVS